MFTTSNLLHAQVENHRLVNQLPDSLTISMQSYISANSINLKEEHESSEKKYNKNSETSFIEKILQHFVFGWIGKGIGGLTIILLIIIGWVRDIFGLKKRWSERKMKKAVKNDNSEALRMQFEHITISKIKSTNREEKLRAIIEAENYDTRGIINTLLDELKNKTKKRNIDSVVIDLMVESIRKCVINLKSKNKK